MKLKLFQKQDLARAALKDGLILGWDTGLGKTWAMFLWPLLKVGFDQVRPSTLNPQPSTPQERLHPQAPVIIIAPGDLHAQARDEALTHFGIVVASLDSQAAFDRLTRCPGSPVTQSAPSFAWRAVIWREGLRHHPPPPPPYPGRPGERPPARSAEPRLLAGSSSHFGFGQEFKGAGGRG